MGTPSKLQASRVGECPFVFCHFTGLLPGYLSRGHDVGVKKRSGAILSLPAGLKLIGKEIYK